MKAFICVLVIILSAAVGNGFRANIKRRKESLDALRRICIKLHNEISFRAPPLSELITKCSEKGCCASLFAQVRAEMKNGFRYAWRTGAEKWSKSVGLTQEELQTVLMLETVGSTDIEGEKRLLNTVAERLSEHSENTKNELQTKGKMLFSCSVLAGLGFVILII